MRNLLRLVAVMAFALVLVTRIPSLPTLGSHAVAAPVADVSTATVTVTATSTGTTTGSSPTASATATATATGASPTATATSTATSTATGASPTATATATGTTTGASPTATATLPPNLSGPTTAYFAEGYTGTAATNGRASFTETLNVLNPAPITATVTLTYYIQNSSTPLTFTRVITPLTALRENVNNDVGPDKFVAAQVSSPQRVYVTRTIYRVAPDGTRLDGSATLPVSAPARSWGFPEGYTGVTFQQYLTILNPSSTQANVTILLAPQASSSAGAKTLNLTVGPLSRATANIRALNLDSAAQSVGMLITSDQPIVPERVLYFGDGAGSGKFGSTVSRGLTVPANQLFIAYGSSGGSTTTSSGPNPQGNQNFITLLNPNTGGGSVHVTASFFDATGRSLGQSQPVTVAAGTRQTIIANNVLGTSAVTPYSVVLGATGPVMAESAQYFGGSPNIGKHPGVDFPAQAQGASDLFLSDLATQQPDGAALNRDVFIYNPSSAAVQVAATYFGVNGTTAQNTYTVVAGGITTVDAAQDSSATIPPGPLGAEYKIANGGSAPIFIYSVGRPNDGLSATEDVGTTP